VWCFNHTLQISATALLRPFNSPASTEWVNSEGYEGSEGDTDNVLEGQDIDKEPGDGDEEEEDETDDEDLLVTL
jgi:hypothetical protein